MLAWRLLQSLGDAALSGAENMALDASLASTARPHDPPALRLYQWRPWAVSLGYHQLIDEIDVERCRANGIDVVRRPTGGRAILHAEELTYSVVLPKSCGLPVRSTAATYRMISEALARGIRRLGAEVTFARSARSAYRGQIACFATASLHELQWQGRKLVGSAQRRFENAVLQHGSILLGNAHLGLLDYVVDAERFGNGVELRSALCARTVSLAEAAGRTMAVSEVVDAVIQGFEMVLKADFVREDQKAVGAVNSASTDTRGAFPN